MRSAWLVILLRNKRGLYGSWLQNWAAITSLSSTTTEHGCTKGRASPQASSHSSASPRVHQPPQTQIHPTLQDRHGSPKYTLPRASRASPSSRRASPNRSFTSSSAALICVADGTPAPTPTSSPPPPTADAQNQCAAAGVVRTPQAGRRDLPAVPPAPVAMPRAAAAEAAALQE